MKRRRSSSSEAAAPGPSRSGRRTGGTLSYDVALPYAAEEDRRLLPRLRVGVQLFDEQAAIIDATPLLDTGAEISVFDGGFAVHAGWSMAEVAARALDVRPIYGLTQRGAAVDGYLHEITCYVGVGAHVAELRVRALITPPNTVAFPVLGRAGFFEQVDVTFAEFEKMLYLRFRNPAISRLFA